MSLRSVILPALVAMLLTGAAAQAADWPSLPAACLPERAQRYDDNLSEAFQAACHCPPTSMCPKTYAQYSNPSLSPLPMEITRQCCPEIEPPSCPAGSVLAGQPVPVDGECDPRCPAGTTYAGQPIPANGQCDAASACPTAHYPSMSEANMQAVVIPGPGGTYKTGEGVTHQFGTDGITSAYYAASDFGTKALASLYGYSIRHTAAQSGFAYWYLGPQSCRSLGNGWCPFQNFYSGHTGGRNDGTASLSQLMGSIGPDNLTWFGFSVADRRTLPTNLVTKDILAAFAGGERLEIADHSANSSAGGWIWTYNGERREVAEAVRRDTPDFLQKCDKAAGEYIQIETFTIGGNRCQYLQCRYVYENTAESCLSADTKVTLADGSQKLVTELKLGDLVKGSSGDHKITASNIYQSALRVMYGINGGNALLTGDHPIKTTEGWKVINTEAAALYASKKGFAAHPLKVGDTLVTDKGEVKVTAIKRFPKVDPISTYNIRVDGNAGFFANGIEVKGFDKMEMHYE